MDEYRFCYMEDMLYDPVLILNNLLAEGLPATRSFYCVQKDIPTYAFSFTCRHVYEKRIDVITNEGEKGFCLYSEMLKDNSFALFFFDGIDADPATIRAYSLAKESGIRTINLFQVKDYSEIFKI